MIQSQVSNVKGAQEARGRVQDQDAVKSQEDELSPAVRELTEDFRRRLGTLDPQQVAIWREMTPAQKLRLVFQAWYFARRVAWTTERQWHPDLTGAELSRRMWRRLHGSETPYDPATQPW